MKRVWLSLSLWVVSSLGVPWAGSPARGDDFCPDSGEGCFCERQDEFPYWERLRAYGECPWYQDEASQPEDVCEIVPDEPTPDQMVTPSSEIVAVESAAESAVEQAMEAPQSNAVAASPDCWYDGETDAYYDYDFAGEASAASRESTAEEPPACVEQACPAEAYLESGCGESALESSETADVATEEAWGGDESYEYDVYADSEWEDDLDDGDFACEDEAAESNEFPYVEPTYGEPGEPVRAWDEGDVEVAEGEDTEDEMPPVSNSDLAEVDTGVILSVARTLDRVGSTLQSLSQYLTEVAAAKTAGARGPTFHR